MPAGIRAPRGRWAILVGALIVGTASPLVRAEADGPDHYRVRGVAAGSAVNGRVGPTTSSTLLAPVPADATCLRNMGCQGRLTFQALTMLSEARKVQRQRENPGRCKVDYRGTVGWVAGRYLAEDICLAPAAAPPRN